MLGPRRFGRPLALLAFVSILALVASGSQRQTAGVAPLQHLRTRRPEP